MRVCAPSLGLGLLYDANINEQKVGFWIHNQHKIETAENNKTSMQDHIADYIPYFHRGKKSTKLRNAQKLRKYCHWTQITPKQMIEQYGKAKETNDFHGWERNQVNKILEYYHWLTEQTNPKTGKKYSLNYCRTEPVGVLAFHTQNTKQLSDITKSFAPAQLPTDEYRFTQDDLRKMFYYGDTVEKALLSLAVCYGQGSKDFLALECQPFKQIIAEARDKNLEFMMWIGEARAKTSIQPRSFLTPECIESLEEYLRLLEKKHGKLPKYLWCNSKLDRHITNEGLNKKLKRLVEKTNLKTYGKRVKFHCIRKFTFSRLRRIDHQIAKIIVAKKVSASDMTYEEINEQCEKVFRLAYKDISLNGDVTGKVKQRQSKKIEELENAITTISKELHAYKTTTETLSKKLEEQEKKAKAYRDKMLELENLVPDIVRMKVDLRKLLKTKQDLAKSQN